jgi:polyisoprenoid-binding protein YceI
MKTKNFVLAGIFILAGTIASAQDKFFTKNGRISFVSKGNIETIEANHKSVTCVLDSKTGTVQFSVLMRGFEFRKALMQEHFNENYVESDKFPRSEFRGQVSNNSAIDYAKDGVYDAKVKGKLTIHGIARDIETDGKITVKGGKPQANATLGILLSDYNISIPGVVKENINNKVTITIDCPMEPLKT